MRRIRQPRQNNWKKFCRIFVLPIPLLVTITSPRYLQTITIHEIGIAIAMFSLIATGGYGLCATPKLPVPSNSKAIKHWFPAHSTHLPLSTTSWALCNGAFGKTGSSPQWTTFGVSAGFFLKAWGEQVPLTTLLAQHGTPGRPPSEGI